MSSSVCLSPVVYLSVTFVRPVQRIEIFDNVSTPLGTMSIGWHPGKILRRCLRKQASPIYFHSDFWPIERYISETMQDKKGAKLVLITNRKSHDLSIGTRLGDLEWPWTASGRYIALFYWIWWTCVPTHNRVDLWRNSCTSLSYFVVRVRCRRKESSRSLSHLLMSFLSIFIDAAPAADVNTRTLACLLMLRCDVYLGVNRWDEHAHVGAWRIQDGDRAAA